MKKLLIATSFIIGVGTLGGIAFTQTDIFTKANGTEVKTTADEAQKIAKNLFKGTIVEFEYDNDLPFPHYDLELVSDNEKVEIEVNALTGKGKITERTPWLNASSSSPITTPNSTTGEQQASEKVIPDEALNPGLREDTTGVIANITLEQAAKIALQQAPGTITSAERDGDVYEFEIRNGQYEYDVDVHVATGAIVKMEKEIDD